MLNLFTKPSHLRYFSSIIPSLFKTQSLPTHLGNELNNTGLYSDETNDPVNPLPTHKTHQHHLILDSGVVLQNFSILKRINQGPLSQCIFLQTVLAEVQYNKIAGKQIFKQLQIMLSNGGSNRGSGSDPALKRNHVMFSNIYHPETSVQRHQGETANDRNDRSIRVATRWLQTQYSEASKLILLTEDVENKRVAQDEGIEAMHMQEYIHIYGDESVTQMFVDRRDRQHQQANLIRDLCMQEDTYELLGEKIKQRDRMETQKRLSRDLPEKRLQNQENNRKKQAKKVKERKSQQPLKEKKRLVQKNKRLHNSFVASRARASVVKEKAHDSIEKETQQQEQHINVTMKKNLMKDFLANEKSRRLESKK